MRPIGLYLGYDPEFVVIDEKGVPVPAHAVGIEKKKPGVLFFRDGYNIELNSASPYSCRETAFNQFKANVRNVQEILQKSHPGYTLASIPAYRIRKKDLLGAPPDVLEFGCSPSQNAYLDGAKGVPDLDPLTHKYRYAGGHLHFSVAGKVDPMIPVSNPPDHPALVKWLDLRVGLPAAFVFDSKAQYRRRRFYGRAGEYRTQKYTNANGLEYRVPGPEIFNHQALFSLFSGLGLKTLLEKGSDVGDPQKGWDPRVEEPLQRAINTGEGLEDLLKNQVEPGFYDFSTLVALKEKMGDQRFSFHPATGNRVEGSHFAWGEYAAEWKLPGPHRRVGYVKELVVY